MIELGYAKAYRLDTKAWPPPEYDGMPPLEDIKTWGAYFWVTQEGLEFHNARSSWWPFEDDVDGELRLREDWAPPEA